MKTTKADSRDKKRNKRRNGMRTDGKSVFVIKTAIENRAKKIKNKRNK